MHALTIARRNSVPDWRFLFKTPEAANQAYDALAMLAPGTEHSPSIFQIKDDFGQRARFNVADITGAMLEDLDESKLAHIESALHEARIRAKIMQGANADPALRVAQMNNQMAGPAMISPMGRN